MINIENNIKSINIINENINKCNIKNKIEFKFSPKDKRLDNFLEIINSFGNINYNNKYIFRKCPIDIKEGRKFNVTGDNNNIITKTGTDNFWSGTICENELDRSIEEHKWKIKILQTKIKKYNDWGCND